MGRADVGPAEQVGRRDLGERMYPVGALVETRNGVKFASSRVEEDRLSFDSDLLEGLQAIGDEAGTDHVHAAHSLLAQFDERLGGIGLEPLGAPEPRLERDAVALRLQSQLLRQQSPGLMA